MNLSLVYSIIFLLLSFNTEEHKQDDIERLIKKLNFQVRTYGTKQGKIRKVDLDDKELIIINEDGSKLMIDLLKIKIKSAYRKGKSSVGFECTDGDKCFSDYGVDKSSPSSIVLSVTIYIDFDSYVHATSIKQNLLEIQRIVTE